MLYFIIYAVIFLITLIIANIMIDKTRMDVVIYLPLDATFEKYKQNRSKYDFHIDTQTLNFSINQFYEKSLPCVYVRSMIHGLVVTHTDTQLKLILLSVPLTYDVAYKNITLKDATNLAVDNLLEHV